MSHFHVISCPSALRHAETRILAEEPRLATAASDIVIPFHALVSCQLLRDKTPGGRRPLLAGAVELGVLLLDAHVAPGQSPLAIRSTPGVNHGQLVSGQLSVAQRQDSRR